MRCGPCIGRTGALVFTVAYRTLGSRDLAEEATQETFVKAWRAAATFDPARQLGPWLARIARHTAIDLYRREAPRRAERFDDATVAGACGRRGHDLRCRGRARGDRRASTPRAGGRAAPAPRVVDPRGDRSPGRRTCRHDQVTLVPRPPSAGCSSRPSSQGGQLTAVPGGYPRRHVDSTSGDERWLLDLDS